MKEAKSVAESVVNKTKLKYGKLPEDQIEEITRRRLICKGCPFMSKNRGKWDKKFETSRKEDFCTLCGCPTENRTASLSSSCGAVVYNARHPKDKKEVKWTSYGDKKR